MGFGSYDEEEQQQDNTADTEEMEQSDKMKRARHNGEVESNLPELDEMMGQLEEIREGQEDE